MNFITNHPYLSITVIVLIMNFTIKKLTRSKHSPLVYLLLFPFTVITQACSPFSGPVDESVSDSYYYSKNKKEIYYCQMGNWFELGETKLNADAETFKVLALDFGKDKNHLYFKENVIDEEVDVASFSVVETIGYCIDKEHVYIPYDYTPYKYEYGNRRDKHLWKIEKANPKTFEKIDSDWSKDDKHYYYDYHLINVDYSSFEVLNKSFAKDKDTVYQLKNPTLLPTPAIDPATAKTLNDRYISDKNNIYDFQEYVDGERVDSLTAFSYKNLDGLKILKDEYLVLDDKVIYDGFEIGTVDIPSFQVVHESYAKDKERVFYLGKMIENADPNTFEIFETPYFSKDKNHVYVDGKILKEADVETFGPAEGKYSLVYRDKNHKYGRGGIINYN
ncbi:DKNYY domain-containing protein [Galbibacter sp. EGI 63066]|uniref:DKNYY domain-containing protein n=1 Tax=Galbibacter sp. EGI 63066 TaxID=2993559 RepID=UPI002248F210|nr:DKNYY domain-containing protein [Galbibacter sp. EGI 63066]MCX2680460.1 DKNYY domain-containing protein [Galbibacter sp. EGI 63066]